VGDIWDDRVQEFLHRVMAAAVANVDPRPLQEEYNRMLVEMPASKQKAMGLTPISVVAKATTKEKK
jgi:hypothetical protein